jgi:hypothetical protein
MDAPRISPGLEGQQILNADAPASPRRTERRRHDDAVVEPPLDDLEDLDPGRRSRAQGRQILERGADADNVGEQPWCGLTEPRSGAGLNPVATMLATRGGDRFLGAQTVARDPRAKQRELW